MGGHGFYHYGNEDGQNQYDWFLKVGWSFETSISNIFRIMSHQKAGQTQLILLKIVISNLTSAHTVLCGVLISGIYTEQKVWSKENKKWLDNNVEELDKMLIW